MNETGSPRAAPGPTASDSGEPLLYSHSTGGSVYHSNPRKHSETKTGKFHVEWFPLNDVGLVPHLYHHLHRRNRQGLPCPYVYLPDTVLFWDNKPSAWFFSSTDDPPRILRKNKANTTTERILKRFLGSNYGMKGLEVKAVFMSRGKGATALLR